MSPFKTETHEVDLCVVGGGLAGMLAAIAAARRGASVALMHDRPVLGGNASSEVRMWICGSEGRNLHETGIIEELLLDNAAFNPDRNYSLWDSVLYGAVATQPGVELLLNCSCNSAEMDGSRIVSVTGWQTTTQRWQKVKAKYFADCSGDSVLAPLTGAEFRVGREARAEFGEPLAPETGDSRTMGMSCLIQARETASPKQFTPPPWANRYPGGRGLKPNMLDFNPNGNYWWLELGGCGDSIADTEKVRDELLRTALGLWDYYKNDARRGAENWELEWLGFLPGKRESRRYVGDFMLRQDDIVSQRDFPDAVAYGGWPLDDHDPNGFAGTTPSNVSIRLNTPYQIPYRCLYSKNVENLLFAGRNISVSHVALSSTRVMCTCGMLGQAAGTAAAIASAHNCSPREVGSLHIGELRQALLDDDCFIPGAVRVISADARAATLSAASSEATDLEMLRNGVDRPVGDAENAATVPLGSSIEYALVTPAKVSRARIVFDSDLNRVGSHKCNAFSNYALERGRLEMPATLARDFRIEVRGADGEWRIAADVRDNRRRLVKVPLGDAPVSGIRLIPQRLWGEDSMCRIFSFDF
ncbi:MAG: FAD-dependent oxidoreductase [Kiritimatiellae bacterium]|nr:FAD-dependent oxidoreductase [Kiritimatiellia bacterium]